MLGKTEKLTIRLTKEEKEILLKESKKNGQSVSAFIIHRATENTSVPVAEKCKIYQSIQAASRYVYEEEGKKWLDKIAESVEGL